MKRGLYRADEVGIFLAQFLGQAGFEDLMTAAKTMADIGYKQLQLPPDCFDLDAAAASRGWCEDNLIGPLGELGLRVSEISYHIPGQLMAVHPAYVEQFAGFLPAGIAPTMQCMYDWGVETTKRVIDASANLGLSVAVGFTGSLLFPYLYPWPQRPNGLVEEGFLELARRWAPVVRYAASKGVGLANEPHPGEDVFDGVTYEMYTGALVESGVSISDLDFVGINYDPSHLVLQGLDPVKFVQAYKSEIKAYHAKDAVYEPDGTCGVYGGYQSWSKRPGRFLTPGTGQVDFAAIEYELEWGGAVIVEWEDPEQDAKQGAEWAFSLLTTGRIPVEEVEPARVAFDDFAASKVDVKELVGVGTVEYAS